MAKVIIHDSSDKEKKIFEKAYEKGVDWHDPEFKKLYQEWYEARLARTGKMVENSPEAFQVAIKMHKRKAFGKGALMDKVIKGSNYLDDLAREMINGVKFK